MQVPVHIGHDLDETTQLYLDVSIALEYFHMRYPVYIAQTTRHERLLYQYYLSLKSLKERHVHWHAENDPKARDHAYQAINPNVRP